MKRILIIVVLVVCAAALGLWRSHGGVRSALNRAVSGSEDNGPGVTGDETRKTFELKPGDRIEVQGINGRVEIQTSDTKTAEVFVQRTGDNPSSLRRRELIIEQTNDGIRVQSKRKPGGLWDHLFGHDPKEEVTIKAPRQIALLLRGINGRVYSTDIDGPLEMKGLNGRAELGQVNGSAKIDGINGNIVVGLNKLGDEGAQIHGVNGGIELRLGAGLNADLTAKGMNGSVKSEISDVTVEKTDWSRYSARIGTGGPEIEIKGINGNVRLTRSNESSSATPSEADKSNAANDAKPANASKAGSASKAARKVD